MQSVLTINQPGAQFLMMGNEAITRERWKPEFSSAAPTRGHPQLKSWP